MTIPLSAEMVGRGPGYALLLDNDDVSMIKSETACRSITATNYTVLMAGDVTFHAPRIVIGDGFGVLGSFAADSTVP